MAFLTLICNDFCLSSPLDVELLEGKDPCFNFCIPRAWPRVSSWEMFFKEMRCSHCLQGAYLKLNTETIHLSQQWAGDPMMARDLLPSKL